MSPCAQRCDATHIFRIAWIEFALQEIKSVNLLVSENAGYAGYASFTRLAQIWLRVQAGDSAPAGQDTFIQNSPEREKVTTSN